jgi:hypothetical protein
MAVMITGLCSVDNMKRKIALITGITGQVIRIINQRIQLLFSLRMEATWLNSYFPKTMKYERLFLSVDAISQIICFF